MNCTSYFYLLMFLTIGYDLGAQGEHIKHGTDWRCDCNDFFQYNVYTAHGPHWESDWIDSFNLCRVRKNRIRSVAVYEFNAAGDSTLLVRIDYDTTGLLSCYAQFADSATRNNLFCDGLYIRPMSRKRKTIVREPDSKEVWIRDTSGYITEYRYFNRGSLGNRIINPIIGVNDHKLVYGYNEDHTEVIEWDIPKRYFSVFRRWTRDPHHRYEYKMDANGNLLSEFSYDLRWDTEQLVQGYKYYYEYY